MSGPTARQEISSLERGMQVYSALLRALEAAGYTDAVKLLANVAQSKKIKKSVDGMIRTFIDVSPKGLLGGTICTMNVTMPRGAVISWLKQFGYRVANQAEVREFIASYGRPKGFAPSSQMFKTDCVQEGVVFLAFEGIRSNVLKELIPIREDFDGIKAFKLFNAIRSLNLSEIEAILHSFGFRVATFAELEEELHDRTDWSEDKFLVAKNAFSSEEMELHLGFSGRPIENLDGEMLRVTNEMTIFAVMTQ